MVRKREAYPEIGGWIRKVKRTAAYNWSGNGMVGNKNQEENEVQEKKANVWSADGPK